MKKIQIMGFVLAIAFALSMACSSKGSNDTKKETEVMAMLAIAVSQSQSQITGSCVYPTGLPGLCFDYEAWTATDAQTNCASWSGTSFSTSACVNVVPTAAPTWTLVGSCLLPVGVSEIPFGGTLPANYRSVVRYYSPQYTAGTAQTNCVGGGGAFTP